MSEVPSSPPRRGGATGQDPGLPQGSRPAPPPPVDGRAVREAFRRHAEGLTIITTLDEFGNPWGMTATAVTSVSLDPPLLLVSLNNGSPLLGPLKAKAHFVVHFLAADQEGLARQFATPLEDKFVGASYRFARSGCARLEGALACLECRPHAVYPGGDHTLVVGLITEIVINEGATDALVYYAGEMKPLHASEAGP